MIYCRVRKKVVFRGSIYEHCTKAGSYRGKLLGLLAVHLVVLAVEKFYDLLPGPRGLVACDNLGGLNTSKQRRKKIPPSTKHADILRSLRRVHTQLSGHLQYQHVYGNQDRKKTWQQMSLLERLNYKCDSIAKLAVLRGIRERLSTVGIKRQLLPLESAAVFHEGKKISGECGKELRYYIGRKEARSFYISQLGWYASTFDNADWGSQDRALDDKPDMFKMWLFKQSSSFCATRKNMGRWYGSEHTSCPNCNSPDEDAAHLLHCRNAGRYALYRSEVEKVVSWLQQGHTDPHLASILTTYLHGRSSKQLSSMSRLPVHLQRLLSLRI